MSPCIDKYLEVHGMYRNVPKPKEIQFSIHRVWCIKKIISAKSNSFILALEGGNKGHIWFYQSTLYMNNAAEATSKKNILMSADSIEPVVLY